LVLLLVVPAFEARAGVFLDGNVIPPMAGVTVTIKYADSDELVVTSTTGADGTFQAGPLYDDVKYLTKAHKNGFHFTIEDDHDAIPTTFRSVRLGSVQVKVTIAGQPLGGVLALLSGANSYKGKDTTNADSGVVEFDGLFPGAYFMRPILKEYEFEPRTVALDIVEGTTKNIDITAVRTGYSCFGQVRSLTREPEKAVTVEAVLVSDNGDAHHEETQTDNAGNFRLRGLRPHSKYTIQLKSSDRVERTLPVQLVIDTGAEDVRDVDFILFRHSKAVDVTGQIHSDPEFVSSITVCCQASHAV
jgi:hypothetical protein